MSDLQAEPNFDQDAQDAAEAFEQAGELMTVPKAYVMSGDELEQFKKAQMALRELNEQFDKFR